jgi:large conductance mechanosensitive channel
MKKSIEEFKAFINKGNAIDLAVGLVMGTAFNNIIKSLVTHIITPFISLLGGFRTFCYG